MTSRKHFAAPAQASHNEFGQNPSPADRIERSAHARTAWRF